MARGRRKGTRGEASKERLLQTAAQAFAENGYYQTKISMIVAQAKVTQPTFYLYFKSKEAVFHELDITFQQELKDLVHRCLLDSDGNIQSDSLKQVISKRLAMIFKYFLENQYMTKIGLLMSGNAEETKRNVASQIADNLYKEQQAGYFRKEVNVQMAAESLVGILERLTMVDLFQKRKEPEKLAEEMTDLFLHGLIAGKD